MAYLLIFVPLAAGVLALAIRSERWRPWLLPVAAAAHGYALSFAVAAGVTAVGAVVGFLGIARPVPAPIPVPA